MLAACTVIGKLLNLPFRTGTCAPAASGGQVRYLNWSSSGIGQKSGCQVSYYMRDGVFAVRAVRGFVENMHFRMRELAADFVQFARLGARVEVAVNE